MRILLVIPPSPFLADAKVMASLGILWVGAALRRAGHDVEALDLEGRTDWLELTRKTVQARRPDAAFITGTSAHFPFCVQIHRAIKETDATVRTVLGGSHATMGPQSAKRGGFDVVVMDDGISGALMALEPSAVDHDETVPTRSGPVVLRGVVRGPMVPTEEWPLPARDLIAIRDYKYYLANDPEKLSTIAMWTQGCPYPCLFSVTGDTVVFTDSGPVRIEALASGVGVARACPHGASVTEYRVDRPVATAEGRCLATVAVYEGMRPTLELRTTNGLSIRGTAEHPLLVADNDHVVWKQLSEIKTGQHVVLRSPDHGWPQEPVGLAPPPLPRIPPGGFGRRTTQVPELFDEDVAWLTGFVIGDGCLPSDHRPEVHVCVTPEVEKRLSGLVPRLFGCKLTIYPSSQTNKMHHGWIRSRAAYEFFAQTLSMVPNKLRIPDVVWRSPRKVVESFLRGLMDADGYVDKDQDEYLITASKGLATEVSLLLMLLGHIPWILEIDNTTGYGVGFKSYRVGIRKRDRIPTSRAIYRSAKSGKWHWRTPRSRGFRGVKRATLLRSGLKHELLKPGWHYVEVASVTPGLTVPVYDLKVPGEHCFVANGFVAHNCGGREVEFYRRYRVRPVAQVMNELDEIQDRWGFNYVQAMDDELNIRKDWLFEFCAAMKKRGRPIGWRCFVKSNLFTDEIAEAMASAGCIEVCTGVESGSDRVLTQWVRKSTTYAINKQCVETARKHGIRIKAFTMVGNPGETREDIMKTRDWILDAKPDAFDVTVFQPYPGSPIFNQLFRDEGRSQLPTKNMEGLPLDAPLPNFEKESWFYKGVVGEYRSGTRTLNADGTTALTPEDLVALRDQIDEECRAALGHGSLGQRVSPLFAAQQTFEAGMGQTPTHNLRG